MKKIVLILLILAINTNVNAELTEEQMNILNSDPAIIALVNNNIEKVRELVNKGAHTSFMLWRSVLISDHILFGNTGIAEMLLKEFHADPNFRYTENEVPLMHVVSIDMLNLLIKHGANVNTRDDNGKTPLIIHANNWPQREIICAIIKAGADVTVKDNKGKTALDYVKIQKANTNISTKEGKYISAIYDDIITLLQKEGAQETRSSQVPKSSTRIDLTDEFLNWAAREKNQSKEEVFYFYNKFPEEMLRDKQKFLQQYNKNNK